MLVPLLNLLLFTAHTHKLLANQRSYQSSNLENHGYWPVPNISFKKWMNLQPGETAKEAAESTSAESLHRSSWDSRFVVDSLAEGLGIIFFLFGILSFSQLMPGKMDQKVTCSWDPSDKKMWAEAGSRTNPGRPRRRFTGCCNCLAAELNSTKYVISHNHWLLRVA